MSSEVRAEWWSIEVFHGDGLSAGRWRDQYEDPLTVAAVTSGALYWEWHEYAYGVLFEVCFASDEQWAAFRALPAVRGALDAVPDPDGLLIYRGRGGASGGRSPRKPKPAPSAAAAELEEPRKHRRLRLRTRSSAQDFRDLAETPGLMETPGTDPRQDPQEEDTPQSPARG
jgi:hypothetical protein